MCNKTIFITIILFLKIVQMMAYTRTKSNLLTSNLVGYPTYITCRDSVWKKKILYSVSSLHTRGYVIFNVRIPIIYTIMISAMKSISIDIIIVCTQTRSRLLTIQNRYGYGSSFLNKFIGNFDNEYTLRRIFFFL